MFSTPTYVGHISEISPNTFCKNIARKVLRYRVAIQIQILKDEGLLFIDFMNMWHLGEGLSFRRSIFTAIKIYLQSTIPSPVFRGNMFFDLALNGSKVKGFVHGFSENEVKFLFAEANFSIVKRDIIGYDSGDIKKKKSQGQFFYIAKKC